MPTRRTQSTRLPEFLRPFFWDLAFARLSWPCDRDLITLRLLSQGSWQAVRWLRRRIGDAQMHTWIKQRRGAGLSPKQLRFWQTILGIPQRLVDVWLAAPQRRVWDKRRHA